MEAEKHLGRDSNQAVKLLIIRDFLISDTNKEHFVKVNDIINHLAENGISAEKKAIYRDLKKIEYDYGLELETKPRIGVRVKN